MKLIIAKIAILTVILLASASITMADCYKRCGLSVQLATFTRDCGSEICYVTECWSVVVDNCGYIDPHNDRCGFEYYGCIQE